MVAGVLNTPPNWKLSMSEMSSASSLARRPSSARWKTFPGSPTVQNSPFDGIPPLKSLTCEPELGSKRSIQTKANSPLCFFPLTWYRPSKTRRSVSMLYSMPSLPIAEPIRYA